LEKTNIGPTPAEVDGQGCARPKGAARKSRFTPSRVLPSPPAAEPNRWALNHQSNEDRDKVMDLSKLLDAIKLSPRYLIPVFFVSGFLIFSPTTYTASLGLDNFVTTFRSWIGLVFLVSSALLLSHFLISGWAWIKRKFDAQKSFNEAINRLRNLTPDEKAVLRGYIFNRTKTQKLDMMDGVVNGLVHKNNLSSIQLG